MKLIDFFPSWMTGGGIFSKMKNTPWDEDDDVDKIALDIEYFGNRSGHAEASALLNKMTAPDPFNPLTEVDIDRLCSVCLTKYGEQWRRRYAYVYKIIYDVLENCNIIEEVEGDETDRGLLDHSGSRLEKQNENLIKESDRNGGDHEEQNENIDISVDNKYDTDKQIKSDVTYFGLGSNTGKKATETIDQETGSSDYNKDNSRTTADKNDNFKEKRSGYHDNIVESEIRDADQNYKDITDGYLDRKDNTKVRKNNLHRHGHSNITNQEMIEQQIKLLRWNFFDSVFSDVDKILTCGYRRSSI